MTNEMKIKWLVNATNEELLAQLLSFEMDNAFGSKQEI